MLKFTFTHRKHSHLIKKARLPGFFPSFFFKVEREMVIQKQWQPKQILNFPSQDVLFAMNQGYLDIC